MFPGHFKHRDRPLKRLLLQGAVILAVLFLALNVQATVQGPTLSQKSAPIAVEGEIRIVSGEIRIDVRDRKLSEVLQRIQELSGLHFVLVSSLEDESITASVKASDWSSAVRKLLKGFSRIEVWNEKNELALIRLFESGEPPATEESNANIPETNRGSRQNLKTGRTGEKRQKDRRKIVEILLTEEQLFELAKVPPGKPIPPHLFHDLEFRHFLELHGIDSLDDWTQGNKAKTVRKVIGKELLKHRRQKKTGE